MIKLPQSRIRKTWRQAGIVLPVVMIFVLVLLGLAGAVFRNVILEEKMSGNLRGQQLAFQAAEQALRFCENHIEIGDAADTGITVLPIRTGIGTNYWEEPLTWDTKAYEVPLPKNPSDNTLIVKVAKLPRCMVEQLDDLIDNTKLPGDPNPSKPQFRVTSRGVGSSEKTVVLLQSYLIL